MRADLLRFRRGRPLAAAPVTALVTEVPTNVRHRHAGGRRVSAAHDGAAARRRPWPVCRACRPTRRRTNTALITDLDDPRPRASLVGHPVRRNEVWWRPKAKSRCRTSSASRLRPRTQTARGQAHLSWKITGARRHGCRNTCSTRTPAGKRVKQNSDGHLTVSAGPGNARSPTDSSTSRSKKRRPNCSPRLQREAYRPRRATRSPSGVVITSNPAPGTGVPKGGVGDADRVVAASAPLAVPRSQGPPHDAAGARARTSRLPQLRAHERAEQHCPARASSRAPIPPPAPRSRRHHDHVVRVDRPSHGRGAAGDRQDASPTPPPILEAQGFSVTTLNRSTTPTSARSSTRARRPARTVRAEEQRRC